MTHNIDSFVLSCIDYRFIRPTVNMMGDTKFDYTTTAGSSLGVNEINTWRKTFTDQIDIAIKLHNIKEIIIVDHMDCGFYKKIYGELYSNTNRYKLHRQSILWAMNNLSRLYPKLKVKGYLIDLDYKILPVNSL